MENDKGIVRQLTVLVACVSQLDDTEKIVEILDRLAYEFST